MKNIRILEDGNRLIVVLEGYDKSAIGALMEVLGTASSPLEHIRPHTGEAQFQLKGTEKEIKTQAQAAPPIKPPAFVEKVQAEEAAAKQNQKPAATRPATRQNAASAQPAAPAAKAAPAAAKPTPAPAQTQATAPKPAAQPQAQAPAAKPAAARTASAAKPAVPAAQQTAQAKPAAPAPAKTDPVNATSAKSAAPAAAKPAAVPAQTATSKAPEKAAPAPQAVQSAAKAAEPAPAPTPKIPAKPVEMMTPFELKDIIRQADRKKLAVIAKRMGAYNTVTSILNADTRTLREFVKRLQTA